MEELIELRKSIENQNYTKALQIIDELEEMSVEDKLNKIYSYMVVLLLHLIKQSAEKKLTRSWDLSIANSVKQINRTNKRRKAGGYYAKQQDLEEIIDDAFEIALKGAAIEAFGGDYSQEELLKLIDPQKIKNKALSLINY
ncbi:MAG: DUF29 family protein [Waterburya sp.]